jgi:hypothetical protein
MAPKVVADTTNSFCLVVMVKSVWIGSNAPDITNIYIYILSINNSMIIVIYTSSVIAKQETTYTDT